MVNIERGVVLASQNTGTYYMFVGGIVRTDSDSGMCQAWGVSLLCLNTLIMEDFVILDESSIRESKRQFPLDAVRDMFKDESLEVLAPKLGIIYKKSRNILSEVVYPECWIYVKPTGLYAISRNPEHSLCYIVSDTGDVEIVVYTEDGVDIHNIFVPKSLFELFHISELKYLL